MDKSKNPSKKQSLQIQELEKELRKLEDQIYNEKKNIAEVVVGYDFAKIKKSVDDK